MHSAWLSSCYGCLVAKLWTCWQNDLDFRLLKCCCNFQELSLAGNSLTEVPEALAQLTSLRLLQLSGNQLRTLPEALCTLPRLEARPACLRMCCHAASIAPGEQWQTCMLAYHMFSSVTQSTATFRCMLAKQELLKRSPNTLHNVSKQSALQDVTPQALSRFLMLVDVCTPACV